MNSSMSRGASMSGQLGEAVRVNLETIEELQDAWCRRYDTMRDPSPPPLLDSPRSLRACALRGVDPRLALQKLSLKQHLYCVLGRPHKLDTLPDPKHSGYKALMQSALRSFSEAAVGLGTSQEKLAAFAAYQDQEKLRVPQLAALRELRRKLLSEDFHEERQPHHKSKHRSLTPSKAAPVVSPDSTRHHERAHHTHSADSLLRSMTREGRLQNLEHLPSSHHMVSAMGVHQASSLSLRQGPLPLSFSQRGATSNIDPGENLRDRGLGDLGVRSSPSRLLPYTPRDVSLLNSSYFSNRSIQSNTSNPSGAPLPTSCPCTPPSSWRGAASTTRSSKLSASRRHLILPEDTSVATTVTDDDPDVLGRKSNNNEERCVLSRQDRSTVSLNSAQLDLLLGMVDPVVSSRPVEFSQPAPKAVRAVEGNKARQGLRSNFSVELLPDFGEVRVPVLAAVATPDSVTNAASVGPASNLSSAPPSQSSSPLSRRTYTNHANRATQLLPNVVARSVSPSEKVEERSACVGAPVASASRVEDDCIVGENQHQHQSLISTAASGKAIPVELTVSLASGEASALSSLAAPPVITEREQHEGFVYYCANPSYPVIHFHPGVPKASTVTATQ